MRGHFGPLAFVVSTFVVFVITLARRFPYINQIPVFDLDVTTSVALMWARSWFWEGPLNLGFALLYSPLSIETPTVTMRRPYESWPPGLVAPIYLTAVVMGEEPSIAMVNWINIICQGLTSLFLSGAAYVLCRYNGWPRSLSGLIAAAVPFVALMQRGPVYFFSQVYTMDPHVLIYVSLFIFFECCYHYAGTERAQRFLSAALLAVGLWGCLVDWLMYFVLAVWIVGRFLGERLRLIARTGLATWIVRVATPFVGFGLFLWWRSSLEGSLMETQGLRAVLTDLVFKVTYRAGLQSSDPLPMPFWPRLWEMHIYYFSSIAPWLLVGSAVAIGVMLVVSLATTRGAPPPSRKALYVTFLAASLATLPVYVQLVVFRQHSVIHDFSVAKVLMPYAFLPFVVIPLLLGAFVDRLMSVRWAITVKTLIALLTVGAAVHVGARYEPPYLIGRIDPARMEMFETIRRNVGFREIVFSPDPTLQARPFMVEMGISNKVIVLLERFTWIDHWVGHVCGPFSVVIVFRTEPADGIWQGQKPDVLFSDGGLTFFKYLDYPGTAKGCP